EKAVLSTGATSSRRARSSGSVRPSPRGYCSVTSTGTPSRRAAAPRILMLRTISSRRSASIALKRRSCTSTTTRTGCGMTPPGGELDLPRRDRGVDADPGRAETLPLALTGIRDPRAHDRRAVPGPAALEVSGAERGQLDVEVDPVEKRTRNPAEVTVPLGRRAQAVLERRAAAPAWVGRGDELEPGREVAHAARPGDRHAPVLEWLTERFEDVLLELRQLVEEEHAEVGKRHLARMGRAAAADQARDGDRVVRGAERPPCHERAGPREEPRDAPDR